MTTCPDCEGGVIETYPEGEPTIVACETCNGTERAADELDDRDESPVDFDSDPDWR